MIKASKFAIAIAAVASLAIATMKASSAAPVTAGADVTIPPATSEVVYRGTPATTMVHTLIVPPTHTGGTRTGIPAPRSIRATTTTIGSERSCSLGAFQPLPEALIPAGSACRDWACPRVALFHSRTRPLFALVDDRDGSTSGAVNKTSIQLAS
jgi:hypothetical protein